MPRLTMFALESSTPPIEPVIHVCLSAYDPSAYPGHEGLPLMSAQLMTIREVDDEIERIKDDLDHIRKAAQEIFQKRQRNRSN